MAKERFFFASKINVLFMMIQNRRRRRRRKKTNIAENL
jgi:hypothetical protein